MKRFIHLLLLIAILLTTSGFGFSDGPDDVASKFLQALFERRYEDASDLSTQSDEEDARFARFDEWMEHFFSPSDLKVIRRKENKQGGEDVILTFNYATPQNARSTERVSMRMDKDGSNWKVAGIKFSSLTRRQATTSQPLQRPQAAAGYPVTIPQNTSSPTAGLMQQLTSDPSKISSLMNMGPVMSMMGDPEIMELAGDPKIMALINDPVILQAVMSGNMQALTEDPRIKALSSDPRFTRVLQKYQNDGGGSGGGVDMQQLLNVLGR